MGRLRRGLALCEAEQVLFAWERSIEIQLEACNYLIAGLKFRRRGTPRMRPTRGVGPRDYFFLHSPDIFRPIIWGHSACHAWLLDGRTSIGQCVNWENIDVGWLGLRWLGGDRKTWFGLIGRFWDLSFDSASWPIPLAVTQSQIGMAESPTMIHSPASTVGLSTHALEVYGGVQYYGMQAGAMHTIQYYAQPRRLCALWDIRPDRQTTRVHFSTVDKIIR